VKPLLPFLLVLRFLCASVVISLSLTANAGTVTTETHGPRNVRVFVPTKPASPTPMILMLHGCTQDAASFADGTQMDAIAEENGIVVAYAEQPSSVTPTKCWQWWDTAHQSRDAGEPKELADAAAAIASAKGVDPDRVYVAGISAGGAMSTIMGATYPDRFAAIGVVAGIEYKASTSFGGVLSASSQGGPDPNTQGDLVFTGMGTRARAVPAIVFHGTSDAVVAKVNGDQVTAQWRRVATRALGDAAVETSASVSATAGYPFTWTPHVQKSNGASIVEYYLIENLGHAWPGGKDGGSYSDPKGPNASAVLWSFFKGRRVSAPLDVAPPIPPTAGTSSSSSSGGTTSGGPSSSSSGTPSNGGPTSEDTSSGCQVSRAGSGSGSTAMVGLSLLLAVGVVRRRRPHR
jgi:poly(hydroxyalkanoate) depolymerase family esterase